MELCVHAHLDYELAGPTDLLSQIEAAATPEQAIEWRDPILLRAEHVACLPAQDRNERRIWLRTPGKMIKRLSNQDNQAVISLQPAHKLIIP